MCLLQAETPVAQHYQVRQDVIRRVDELVRSGLRGYKGMHVEHYGSFTSRLFTPSGDLDIAIEGRLWLENEHQTRSELGAASEHVSACSHILKWKIVCRNP